MSAIATKFSIGRLAQLVLSDEGQKLLEKSLAVAGHLVELVSATAAVGGGLTLITISCLEATRMISDQLTIAGHSFPLSPNWQMSEGLILAAVGAVTLGRILNRIENDPVLNQIPQ